MSKLNTKEFAAAIGKPVGTVRGHISRKKILRDADGYIDTDDKINKRYIHQQTKGKGLYSSTSVPSEKTETESKRKAIVKHDNRSLEEKRRSKTLDDIELRTKKAALEKAEYDAELKKLDIEKRAGKLLPIELVQRIMTINIQSIFRNFEKESENLAGIFSEVLGGSRAELSEIIKRSRESLDISIKKAKEDSTAEIEAAIDEYAETRSRGERK